MEELPGLTTLEADERLKEDGLNTIVRRNKISAGEILLNQIMSPLMLILGVAAVITLILTEPVDGLVILASVLANVVLGFTQEWKAEKSIEALSQMVEPKAKVKRDGEWTRIDSSKLVAGDLVRLEIGMVVPADGVLVMEDGMFTNEAILTGESVGVEKMKYPKAIGDFESVENKYKCLMGTIIERGIGEIVVQRTGMKTNLGMIASRLEKTQREKTPLQMRLERLSGQLALMVGVIVFLVVLIGLMTNRNLIEIFTIAVALAVAAIPEGLVVGLVVILSVGMKRILAKRALIRKLNAAETLGSVDVICLDKTGTITEGKMMALGAVSNIKTTFEEQLGGLGQEKKALQGIIEGAILCNDLRDPLEIAMEKWVLDKIGEQKVKQILANRSRTDELSFDPKYRYIVTRHKHAQKGGKAIEYLSGAPEIILKHSKVKSEVIRKKWLARFVEIGNKGHRMVAFAVKDLPVKSETIKIDRDEVGGYEFLGLIVFDDPVRSGVAASLAEAIKAGIKIKVITGDYKETAWSILKQVGLVSGDFDPTLVMTGEELKVKGTECDKCIEKTLLFARTLPEQKLEVVESLQKMGHVVAMTGDGVNDAPALKQADIGVVLNNASDVARETAEMVLLDNNFETILSAVEEGRLMFENLRKVVLYLLSDAFAGIILVVGGLILRWPLPLLATQILWINLVTDGLPYISLALEKKPKDLIRRRPVDRNEPIINKGMMILIGIISVSAGLLTLISFGFHLYVLKMPLAEARTVALATMGTVSLMYVFSVRSLFAPIWKKNPIENVWLILGVALGMMLLLAVIYSKYLNMIFNTMGFGWSGWEIVLVSVVMMMLIIEGAKNLILRGQTKHDLMKV